LNERPFSASSDGGKQWLIQPPSIIFKKYQPKSLAFPNIK
jgi:hypothetical protein